MCSVNVYVGKEENVGQCDCTIVYPRLRYLNLGYVFLTLKGLRRQLQDDLLRSVWRDIEPVVWAVEAILGGNNRLEADEGMIGFGGRLRPDLHICQRVGTVNRLFLDR